MKVKLRLFVQREASILIEEEMIHTRGMGHERVWIVRGP